MTTSGSSSIESWLREAARDSTSPEAAPQAPLRVGAALGGGRFVVGEVLGRGGMGTVYAVRDVEHDVSLALKTMLDTDPGRLLAFKNEFRALQDLHHPNLVYLGEMFEDDGRWFFTMERIVGATFTRFVRPGGVLDPARLRACLAQLADGLEALHGAGKVHRDVKPSNTLVTHDGRVVLLDFGMIADARGARRGLSGFGTVAYMAPEQASGACGPAADWYACGVMLYEALTGAPPFVGSRDTVLVRKQTEVPPPPASRVPGVPADLDRLCVELLDRHPSARPAADDVRRRLRAAGRRAPPPAASPAPVAAQAAAVSPAAARPFVGRARELGLLHDALARARTAGPLTVLVRVRDTKSVRNHAPLLWSSRGSSLDDEERGRWRS